MRGDEEAGGGWRETAGQTEIQKDRLGAGAEGSDVGRKGQKHRVQGDTARLTESRRTGEGQGTGDGIRSEIDTLAHQNRQGCKYFLLALPGLGV